MMLFHYFLFPFVMILIRYFLFAGVAFLVCYKFFAEAFSKNKIQSKDANKADFKREIVHSLQTSIILGVVTLLIVYTPLKDISFLYEDMHEYPLWWMPISVLVALAIHDTYFYWMHRAIHHPALFKRIHYSHHESINPSPFAAYTFSFIEGVLQGMISPILIFSIPMHPLSMLYFVLIGLVINVYGHLGYEIAPKWLRNSFLFGWINTSVYHNLHHQDFKGNYSLYFRFWDRVMNTENKRYTVLYDEVQKRRFDLKNRVAGELGTGN